MSTGILTVPYTPVRSEPGHKAEQKSQLVFGETYEVVREEKSWIEIRSHFDDYTGWIDRQHYESWEAEFRSVAGEGFVINADYPLDCGGEPIWIPAGSFLPIEGVPQKEGFTLLGKPYHFKGEHLPQTGNFQNDVLQTALNYLNAPYLWGGKIPWGIDCSGLSQLVYKLAQIVIPRDSWKQAEAGMPVSSLEESRPGDLAFFEEEGRITHVGLLMKEDRIIHASGKVRIDPIDQRGIYRPEMQDYSHKLKLIKRIKS